MAEQLALHRKRRGVVRASLTRLNTKLSELEATTDAPDAPAIAQTLATRLKTLDAEFRKHHLTIVDLTEGEEALATEQDSLDTHDDNISLMSVRIDKLISTSNSVPKIDPKKLSSKRLTRLLEKLTSIKESVNTAADDVADICKLQQHQEQIAEMQGEIKEIRSNLLEFDLESTDPLVKAQTDVEEGIFDCSLAIKKRLHPKSESTSSTTPDVSGVKLPKLEVPTFDGDILNWRSFWQQFDVSIHSRSNLTSAEKLVYLQSSLKDGTSKRTIEGLTKSGEHYEEAIKCLKERYDRPRLVHQKHVRTIIDAPPLKEGNGKEIRVLHDIVVQHLRALKAIGHEPSNSFITSLIELKLDTTTMFEWQRHSQDDADVPDYQKLLDFLNLRAQASEASGGTDKRSRSYPQPQPTGKNWKGTAHKQVNSFTTSANPAQPDSLCIACKSDKHPLYTCPKFRSLSHDCMISLLKANGHCLNCLRSGHFLKDCKSLHHCKRCQRPHHTLLHVEAKPESISKANDSNQSTVSANHASISIKAGVLLMTCQVRIETPQGSIKVRALLDSASEASFVSERIAQALSLQRHPQNVAIRGIAGVAHGSNAQSLSCFEVSSLYSPTKKFNVTAIVVPRITHDLPTCHVASDKKWKHLTDLKLADPDFGKPSKIDLLLGAELFVDVMRQGRRKGSPDSPAALETVFGWVLAGNTGIDASSPVAASHHVSTLTGDDLLRQFWETEEKAIANSTLTPEERAVLKHFEVNHSRTPEGRFMVPLPKRVTSNELGESRTSAVRRFISFERSLHAKGQFDEFQEVMDEYFCMQHAEKVPQADLDKPTDKVFYLPIHAVRKETSTTTKVRAVFDASAKTSNGRSLNDILLVGPTVHPPLVDVLIQFRMHRIVLIADVSRMYRAVLLTESDRDLHRFVWRSDVNSPLIDYRMTRLTFGVSASSFIANMCVKQNASDHEMEYPNAAKSVQRSFYVDDCLTGSNSIEEAVQLQGELQELFNKGGFLLRKWNSNDSRVIEHLVPELRDTRTTLSFSSSEEYTKTLGIEWNPNSDHFRLTIANLSQTHDVTKRALVSDIASTFDALGWYSPTIVKAKILLQMVWSERIGWDDKVPETILKEWLQWRSELSILSDHHIARCYFPRDVNVVSIQLHGFSDASEKAYCGVVYIRLQDSDGVVHTSVVISKTRVAPIKRVTIPRLELCGALLVAQLLSHCKKVLEVPMDQVFAWTDSTIVLNWIQGSPRRFKIFVGNRVSQIMELLPPDRWGHVISSDNPADCGSRGLFPTELVNHNLWWKGPEWLGFSASSWPRQPVLRPNSHAEEANELCSLVCTVLDNTQPIFPFDRYSSFNHVKRITAWVMRFVWNCRAKKKGLSKLHGPLSVDELVHSMNYWVSISQRAHFARELGNLKKGANLPRSSCLISLHPILDEHGLLRVGGRQHQAQFSHVSKHPLILHSKHPIPKLMIRSEHERLLHAGPLLLQSSLSRRFHFIGGHKAIRSVTRSCVTCRRKSARPKPPSMGQLPPKRITPDAVFSQVGVDYAGPLYVKQGSIRKPVMVKAYVCVFVSLTIKAVHLELVSDLTTEAFIACLRRFIGRRGKPTLIWSDHGSNFVGAKRVIQELFDFLKSQQTNEIVSKFCSNQGISWDFIPEHAPHFGGLWESAVKSFKTHLYRVVSNARLNFEELTTVLVQIEACLNSRPLGIIPTNDDGIEVLTPGHFLIGRPLEALPDHSSSFNSLTLLRRWYLCEALTRHFWKRWSTEYLVSLRKHSKWHRSSKNLSVGDVVVLREDGMMSTQWPLGRVVAVHPGKDGITRVVTLKTKNGTYTRPVTKVASLLSCEQ